MNTEASPALSNQEEVAAQVSSVLRVALPAGIVVCLAISLFVIYPIVNKKRIELANCPPQYRVARGAASPHWALNTRRVRCVKPPTP